MIDIFVSQKEKQRWYLIHHIKRIAHLAFERFPGASTPAIDHAYPHLRRCTPIRLSSRSRYNSREVAVFSINSSELSFLVLERCQRRAILFLEPISSEAGIMRLSEITLLQNPDRRLPSVARDLSCFMLVALEISREDNAYLHCGFSAQQHANEGTSKPQCSFSNIYVFFHAVERSSPRRRSMQ